MLLYCMTRKFKQNLVNTLLVFCILAGSLTLSWNVLKHVDFFYLSAYKIFKIEKNNEQIKYLLKDENKKEFIKLDFQAKRNLFIKIIDELDNGGRNLTDLTFEVDGKSYPLLTRMESGRLLAISELIFGFKIFSYVMMLVGLFLIIAMVNNNYELVSKGRALIGVVLYTITFLAVWIFQLSNVIVPFGMYWMFDMKKGLLGGIFGSEAVLWYIFIFIIMFGYAFFLAVYMIIKFLLDHYNKSSAERLRI